MEGFGWMVVVFGWIVGVFGWIVGVFGWTVVVFGWKEVVFGWNSEELRVSSNHRDSGSLKLCAFSGLPVSPCH